MTNMVSKFYPSLHEIARPTRLLTVLVHWLRTPRLHWLRCSIKPNSCFTTWSLVGAVASALTIIILRKDRPS